MDETWILQRFLARDEEGLAAAYAQLGPGLTALAARIAGLETAEECVNDALLAAWQAPLRSRRNGRKIWTISATALNRAGRRH